MGRHLIEVRELPQIFSDGPTPGTGSSRGDGTDTLRNLSWGPRLGNDHRGRPRHVTSFLGSNTSVCLDRTLDGDDEYENQLWRGGSQVKKFWYFTLVLGTEHPTTVPNLH